jgi:hypothetical protein
MNNSRVCLCIITRNVTTRPIQNEQLYGLRMHVDVQRGKRHMEDDMQLRGEVPFILPVGVFALQFITAAPTSTSKAVRSNSNAMQALAKQ